jgi:H/ACA ribonucleoprotein complex subunit 4
MATEKKSIDELLNFGVVFIDKPKGPTSHQVSAWVKNILQVSKAGHAGTLDPNVTGILPVSLNKATRIVNFIHLDSKEYIALMRLHKDSEPQKIMAVMNEFQGVIFQTPPVRAAVARRLRKRTIYKIDILEISKRDVLFKVSTEAGTYIRTLCVDIGDALGVGAHMEELRRTRTGIFDESMSCTLQNLLDGHYYYLQGDDSYLRKLIHPGEELAGSLPKIVVRDLAVDALAHGSPLYFKGVNSLESKFNKGDYVSLYTKKEELIGVGISAINSEDYQKMNSGMIAKVKEVIIERGIYPSFWKKKYIEKEKKL